MLHLLLSVGHHHLRLRLHIHRMRCHVNTIGTLGIIVSFVKSTRNALGARRSKRSRFLKVVVGQFLIETFAVLWIAYDDFVLIVAI